MGFDGTGDGQVDRRDMDEFKSMEKYEGFMMDSIWCFKGTKYLIECRS